MTVRARVSASAASLSFVAALSACSLLNSTDGLAGGPGGSDGDAASTADTGAESDGAASTSDGGTSDGALVDGAIDAGDAGSDALSGPQNLHPNGTFETGIAPWGAYQGTVASDSTARGGTKSLRACTRDGTLDYFTADDGSALGGPVMGATYRAEVWVRTAPGAVVPPSVALWIRSANYTGGFQSIETDNNDGPPLTATWQKLSVTLKITKPAERLGIFVGADQATNACFLIDDVTLVRLP